MISVVGFLDSIVAAKQNSARFGYSISPNRELVALGAGNLVASFVPGTLPAYGSITRYLNLIPAAQAGFELDYTATDLVVQIPHKR